MSESANGSGEVDAAAAYDVRDDIYAAEDAMLQQRQEQEDSELSAANARLEQLLNPPPPSSTTQTLPPPPLVHTAPPPIPLPRPPADVRDIVAALKVIGLRVLMLLLH